MKDEHVSIDMDPPDYGRKGGILLTEETMDFVGSRSERSLKQYYLGCSCSVCYQRYQFSKGYHCCDSKSRCNVRRYEKCDDLEETVDACSAPVERKCEEIKQVEEYSKLALIININIHTKI